MGAEHAVLLWVGLNYVSSIKIDMGFVPPASFSLGSPSPHPAMVQHHAPPEPPFYAARHAAEAPPPFAAWVAPDERPGGGGGALYPHVPPAPAPRSSAPPTPTTTTTTTITTATTREQERARGADCGEGGADGGCESSAAAVAVARARPRPPALSLNYLRVDTLAISATMFLVTALSLVPSIFYAHNPACPHSAFEVQAFLLAFSSAAASGLVLGAALAHRDLARETAGHAACPHGAERCRAPAAPPALLRRLGKRASALSATAFTATGFSAGAALGAVVARSLHDAGGAGCPGEYADVVVAASLLLLSALTLTGARQVGRHFLKCVGKGG